MGTVFFLKVGLIIAAFALCFWFRKGNGRATRRLNEQSEQQ